MGWIWAVIAVLVVIWIISFLVVHITGLFIHLLLVIAVILLVVWLVTGRA